MNWLIGSTPILQGPFRALTHIQFPAAHHSLEDGRAVHGLAEQFQLRIDGCRHRVAPGLAGTAGGTPCPALSISGISPNGDREARRVQGRRLVRRLRSGFPCGPTGASGSTLLLCGFRHAPGCAGRTCERRVFPRRGFGWSDLEAALLEMLGAAVVEDPLGVTRRFVQNRTLARFAGCHSASARHRDGVWGRNCRWPALGVDAVRGASASELPDFVHFSA